jgi:hypothetical protein
MVTFFYHDAIGFRFACSSDSHDRIRISHNRAILHRDFKRWDGIVIRRTVSSDFDRSLKVDELFNKPSRKGALTWLKKQSLFK